jgi:hypothetical protein
MGVIVDGPIPSIRASLIEIIENSAYLISVPCCLTGGCFDLARYWLGAVFIQRIDGYFDLLSPFSNMAGDIRLVVEYVFHTAEHTFQFVEIALRIIIGRAL